MKKMILILFLTVTTANAQMQIDTRKHIIVTGSAEMSIQPDEVQLEIFVNSSKNGERKDFAQIQKEFRRFMAKHKMDPNTIVMETTHRWSWWYWRDNYYQRSVKLNVDGKTDITEFLKDLDREWNIEVRIVQTNSKDLQKFRKEVKKEAIKAAKEKAKYLLEDIGEQLGGVLSVEEVPETNNNYWYNNTVNLHSNAVISRASSDSGVAGIADIKLRYEVKIKFEIK